jgi:exonuclease III
MKILFWNTNKNKVNDVIKEMIVELKPDMIGLAEYKDEKEKLLKMLSDEKEWYFHLPKLGCERIDIFSRYSVNQVDDLLGFRYYTIKRIPDKRIGMINIALVHFPILHKSKMAQAANVNKLRTDIERIEKKLKNRNTVVIGDFNMNPFDEGMYGALGLHAIPFSYEADKISRIISEQKNTIFIIQCGICWVMIKNLMGVIIIELQMIYVCFGIVLIRL